MRRGDYDSWLVGQILLLGLLGASLALFVSSPALRTTYDLPDTRLVLDTGVALAAAIVAVLAGVRFSVEGRRLDLLIAAGFLTASAGTMAFEIAPQLSGGTVGRAEAWAGVGAHLAAGVLIAAAPYVRGRGMLRRPSAWLGVGVTAALGVIWLLCRALGDTLPSIALGGAAQPALLTAALALQALASVVALVGFGLRFRARGEDLDRWFALAASLALFAELHLVFTPVVSESVVSQGNALRLLSYGVLLLGVWRAIRAAEFGRAVGEERARLAREIHDGLAQYLFAIATHTSMLENGAPLTTTLPALKEAAAAAQREARFAVLALSSASGTASFDAALRRYIDVVTADGELEVDLDVAAEVHLAPDEQIEVFRIVQEGLANVRKHAAARHAHVRIGVDGGRRLVSIVDDGEGFDVARETSGHGLRNMGMRARTVGGALELRSSEQAGTAVHVTLRP